MRALLTLTLLVFACAATAQTSASDADRWDLSGLYAGDATWSADVQKLEAGAADLAACRSHLGDSAATLRRCLELQSDVLKRFFRALSYASLRFDEDTGVAASLERRQRVRVLGTRLREAAAFMDPEILALGRARIDEFLGSDAALRAYAHPLDDVLRRASHTLDAPREQLIAAFGLTADTPSSTYGVLTQADLPWPRVRLSDGTEFTLDESAYTLHRQARARDDRRKVMDAFFGALKTYERTLGMTLYGQLKEDAVVAKVRGYRGSLARAGVDLAEPAPYQALAARMNAIMDRIEAILAKRG